MVLDQVLSWPLLHFCRVEVGVGEMTIPMSSLGNISKARATQRKRRRSTDIYVYINIEIGRGKNLQERGISGDCK